MKLETIAFKRLDNLGCERIPREVRERIAIDFERKVIVQLEKIAKRQITIPRVARAFVDVASKTNGVNDDLLILPVQADETNGVAGT